MKSNESESELCVAYHHHNEISHHPKPFTRTDNAMAIHSHQQQPQTHFHHFRKKYLLSTLTSSLKSMTSSLFIINSTTIPPFLTTILIVFLVISFQSYFVHPANCQYYNTSFAALIEKKEKAVLEICEKAKSFHITWPTMRDQYSSCVFYDACDASLSQKIPNFDCNYNFGYDQECGCSGEKLSLNDAVVKYAPDLIPGSNDLIREFECMSNSLRDVFRQNLFKDPTVKWQYLASTAGAMQLFPGVQWRHQYQPDPSVSCREEVPAGKPCPSFDPRIRPWYITAAAGSKSIIIILDVSSSMGSNSRIEIAISAALSVIDGLSRKDRLALIFFSDNAFTCAFSGDQLLFVNNENYEKFKKCIMNITPFGQTNFENAFNLAFKLFENDQTQNKTCNNVILFLTDGKITSGILPDSIIKEKNEKFGVKLFTFSLGNEADEETPRRIACDNGGLWKKIADGNIKDLRTQMSSYYDYLSYRDNKIDGVSWSEIYTDTTGLGDVSTASLACFASNGRLLGVAGVDVPLSTLSEFPNPRALLNEIAEKRDNCPPKIIPQEFIDELRGGVSCNYCSCPRDVAIYVSVTVVVIVLCVGVIGVIILSIIYSKFIKKKRWTRLQQALATSYQMNNIPLNSLNNPSGGSHSGFLDHHDATNYGLSERLLIDRDEVYTSL